MELLRPRSRGLAEHPAEQDNAKSRAVVYKKTPDTRPLLFQVGHCYVQSHGKCISGWPICPQHTGAGPRLGVEGVALIWHLVMQTAEGNANISRIMKQQGAFIFYCRP